MTNSGELVIQHLWVLICGAKHYTRERDEASNGIALTVKAILKPEPESLQDFEYFRIQNPEALQKP